MAGVNSSKDDGKEWFIAHMKRFPLLDGLAHERFLSEKIIAGIEAQKELGNGEVTGLQRGELEKIAIEGAGAFMTMYECNLRLVVSYANRYKTSTSYDSVDVIQDGCVGLRRAIQKYDHRKGFKFSTYATFWIKQSIDRRKNEIAYDVRLPNHAYQTGKDIQKLIGEYIGPGDARMTDKELLDMGYTETEIHTARNLMRIERVSLDKPLGEDSDADRYQLVPAHDTNFDEQLDEDLYITGLGRVVELAGLDYMDKLILSMREGVIIPGIDYSARVRVPGTDYKTVADVIGAVRYGGEKIKLDQIGIITGLTRERVRQRHEDTRSYIIGYLATTELVKRLNLSDEETKEVRKYLSRKNVIPPGRPSSDQQDKLKAMSEMVVGLIGLLDENIDITIKETLDELKVCHDYGDSTIARIKLWLEARFKEGEYPVRPIKDRDAREHFELDTRIGRIADYTFVAILTGIWGKLPKELTEDTE